jgi:hypothetical protein
MRAGDEARPEAGFDALVEGFGGFPAHRPAVMPDHRFSRRPFRGRLDGDALDHDPQEALVGPQIQRRRLGAIGHIEAYPDLARLAGRFAIDDENAPAHDVLAQGPLCGGNGVDRDDRALLRQACAVHEGTHLEGEDQHGVVAGRHRQAELGTRPIRPAPDRLCAGKSLGDDVADRV